MDRQDGREHRSNPQDRHTDSRTGKSRKQYHRPRDDMRDPRSAASNAARQPEHQDWSKGPTSRFHRPLELHPPTPVSQPKQQHVSAMSVSDDVSRPVSEIESEYQPDPTAKHGHVSNCTSPGLSKRPHHAPAESNGSLIKLAMAHSTPPRTTPRKYSMPRRESETLPPAGTPRTMAALSDAIRSGIGQPTSSYKAAKEEVRMPFQGEPESPTSIYTDVTHAHLSVPLSTYQGYNPRHSKPSTISERGSGDFEKSPVDFEEHDLRPEILTPNSFVSTSPMLAEQQPGLSAKIPAGKRPPRLDMSAVREAEARGSMSSLTDLIRRATKLASNLDRGNTASRFGHLDMFGSSSEKLGHGARGSTYSDVLASFPPPADGGTPGKDRPNTMWPYGKEGYGASKSSLGKIVETAEQSTPRPKRRCCGLSPPVFVILLLLFVILIAAAVLLPIFLILLPNQRKAEAAAMSCPASYVCHNDGQKVFVNNVCSCICVDGCTGQDCSTTAQPDCATADIRDGSKLYSNATVGKLVMPLLTSNAFGLPFNTTSILATFNYNNMSCVSENSLVDFDRNTTLLKRGLPDYSESYLLLNELQAGQAIQPPTRTLQIRQEATQSANGIVFATSSAVQNPKPTATGSATSSASAGNSVPSATASPAMPNIEATTDQINFASAVVLYVLQTFSNVTIAVASNQAITAFFQESIRPNNTVQVVSGSQKLQADFATLELIFANGTRIGGSK